MKTGIYLCRCGCDNTGNVSAKIDLPAVREALINLPNVGYCDLVNLACSEDGQNALADHLAEHKPDRVVIAACSPREHEETFRKIMIRAGLNPYLMQMVNIREHIAWVTEDLAAATEKAVAALRAAVNRVSHHEALAKKMLDVSTDVLVVGAGPAGLKAALTLAEAGRQVTLVEKSPILGGYPVRFEDIFPKMECGPCLLEPIMGQVLHSDLSDKIDLRLLSELVEVTGFFGNFNVKIRQQPRFVSTHSCIGCGICMPECPVEFPSRVNLGRTQRRAIDYEFFGGLPNVPFIDPTVCTNLLGGDCTICRDSCPVEGTIDFDDKEQIVEKHVGAIILAIGAKLYDVSRVANLGHGVFPEVYDSFAFERLIANNGPTDGRLVTKDGREVKRLAIVHCAGSLDKDHLPHCSAVCCLNAFKFNHLVGHKSPGTEVVHFHKTIVAPGKEDFECYHHARHNDYSTFIEYHEPSDLQVSAAADGSLTVTCSSAPPDKQQTTCDMVVLMNGLTTQEGADSLSKLTEVTLDQTGFFEELNGRSDVARSKVRGVYLAGICQQPGDIARSMMQGAAAAGNALSGLVTGRQLAIEPVTAEVDADRCSGCRTCIPVCPYKAIEFVDGPNVARVNAALCVGCGTCVAACPAGVIKGNHFTNDEIYAEIEALLR